MTETELEFLLHRWGIAMAGLLIVDDDNAVPQMGYGTNPIANGMAFAPKTRSEALRYATNMDRSGNSRRRVMGRAVGMQNIRSVPKWSCEPIPSTETRPKFGASKGQHLPPELERMQNAVMSLYRADKLRGACVICEYQLRGRTQAEKAVAVGQRVGHVVKLRRYRDELAHARTWLHGRLAVAS